MRKIIFGTLVSMALIGSAQASVESVYASVGGFFFSNLWSGTCDQPGGGGPTCIVEDPNYNPAQAFVPITSIDDSGLLVSGGSVTGGSLVVDAYSPTFMIPLGVITFDFDAGSFALIGGLGSASGNIAIDAAGVMTGLVTAATGTVGFLLCDGANGGSCPPLTVPINGGVGVVPIPAAAWLFGSALLGLAGIRRRKS